MLRNPREYIINQQIAGLELWMFIAGKSGLLKRKTQKAFTVMGSDFNLVVPLLAGDKRIYKGNK